MVRVRWTRAALKDLRALRDYIAEDSPHYARQFTECLAKLPRKLRRFPRLGRIVPEFQDDSFRELIHGSYRIFYLLRGNTCYVVSIIHGSRDLLRHIPGLPTDLS